ncbi:peroxide stress protein YaaA [Kutzneria sp. CA-103260]|uniref:peroxide stress protein YaaA n=1 Tax=Kutzneria sp. CA-103260 TaxID=2802641 RepID=UPI001BA5C940|nr:peroxide stress protein YaaA [Kutzneria sp. CA-103260]QUQ71590.1 peroxide stress protein YaaA [Kutzneria sp. CA-103260]
MLVLLPPSETKSDGGAGGPLDLDALSFPELTPLRRKLADALVTLAGDVPASLRALELSERQHHEVHRNAALLTSPTAPALSRYTGVLYDALDQKSLTKTEKSRADGRLGVASALFGVVRAGDPIPAYRLSGGSTLPGVGALGALWRPELEPVLRAADELVVDMRSGAYAALARVPAAVVVKVIMPNGKTVSHHNKAYKGRLARVLATAQREPSTVAGLVRTGTAAGLIIRQTGDRAVDLVVMD